MACSPDLLATRHLQDLPNDVMCEIFWFCSPETTNLSDRHQPMQITLSHVCKQWRTGALGSKRLWASFSITLAQPTLKKQRVLFNEWLSRSGAHALDVDIDSSTVSQVGLAAFFNKLKEESHRWRMLKISFHATSFLLFRSLQRDQVPILESLSIRNISKHWHNVSLPPRCFNWAQDLAFLSSAPRLHTFTVHMSIGSLRPPDLPWRQIVFLHLKSTDGSTFPGRTNALLTILSQCRMLDTFELELSRSWRYALPDCVEAPPAPPVTLLTIRTLRLVGDVAADLQSINVIRLLENLTSPNLRHFELFCGAQDGAAAPTVCHQFLLRSACALQSFSIGQMSSTDAQLLAILQLCSPSIEQLTVGTVLHSPLTNRLVKILTVGKSDESPICPRLRTIDWTLPHSMDIDGLLELFRSRTYCLAEGSTTSRLKRIKLRNYHSGYIKPAEQERLKQAGVEVII